MSAAPNSPFAWCWWDTAWAAWWLAEPCTAWLQTVRILVSCGVEVQAFFRYSSQIFLLLADLGQIVAAAFSPRASTSEEVGPAANAAAETAVPWVNIMAGAGDYSLPLTHAGAAAAGPGDAGLTVLMRDLPGVWTTASHKVGTGGMLDHICASCWLT